MKFLVEILFWERSWDGDDWIDGQRSFGFEHLQDAVNAAANQNPKGMIESTVYDISEGKNIIWQKDWQSNKIIDHTI